MKKQWRHWQKPLANAVETTSRDGPIVHASDEIIVITEDATKRKIGFFTTDISPFSKTKPHIYLEDVKLPVSSPTDNLDDRMQGKEKQKKGKGDEEWRRAKKNKRRLRSNEEEKEKRNYELTKELISEEWRKVTSISID